MTRIRRCFSRLLPFGFSGSRSRKPRRAARLSVEALEDRTVPSTFIVDSTLDTVDAAPGDGQALDANNRTSLRAAIMEANALAGADIIQLPAGQYDLTRPGSGENAASTGDLDITGDLSIVGAARDTTVINGGGGFDRVFHILQAGIAPPTVSLANLTVTGGRAPTVTGSQGNGGGGILSEFSTLTLNNVAVRGNRSGDGSFGGDGGGVYTVVGTTTIANCLITQNTTGNGTIVGGDGGGVASLTSTTTIRDSVISNNRTGDGGSGTINAGDGGGIASQSASTNTNGFLTILRTTISGNAVGTTQRGDGGGLIAHDERVVLDSSVVSGNTAWRAGGVELDGVRSASILNSTISANTATAGGAGGLYHSTSFDNLISGTTISGTTISGNQAPNSNQFDGGGGIVNQGQIDSIINSTISGNSTNAVGGGIANYDNIGRIVNVTIANNTGGDGGGLFHMLFANFTPVIGTLSNTIIADNTATTTLNEDFVQLGVVTTAVNNLLETRSGHPIVNGVNGNIVGIDPLLGPLAANGGLTQTHALLSGSVAVNAGTATGAPTTDQRGLPRPAGGGVDIGAFEAQGNRAPAASNQARTTNEDTALTGTLSATDADGDPLTFAVVANPAHGTVTLNTSTGAYTYTPAANYNGPDSFPFKANDGSADSNVATVSITVNAVNDAPVANNDSYTVNEDTTLNVSAPGVLGNDTDVEGTALSAVVVGPANGTLTLNANGSFTYRGRPNFNGTDSFTYRARDTALLESNLATVTITVNAVNDAPFPSPIVQNVSTPEDTALPGQVVGVDVDGDALTFSLVQGPEHGTLSFNANGSFTYTPAANYNGPDGFVFRVADPSGASNLGGVSITVSPVNDAPVAANDAYSVDEDGTLSVSVTPVTRLRMVSEPGDFIGQGLTYDFTPATAAFSASRNFDNGVSLDVDPPPLGEFWFLDFAAPNEAVLTAGVYLDAMRFPFQDPGRPGLNVSGNGRGSNTLTGRFTVYDVALGGTAVTRFAAAFEQHSEGAAPALVGWVMFNSTFGARGGVLANDTDSEGDLLLGATLVNGPTNGTLSFNGDGTFTYTPNANFHGTDSFTYRTNDGRLDSNLATVTITVSPVNDAPVARDDSATTAEDNAVTIAVLGNDSDVDGDGLTVTAVTQGSNGSVALNANGTVTYTPAANYHGPDSFTYTLSDGQGGTASATVRVTVTPVNDAPVARDDSATTAEDNAVIVAVLGNDSDADGDSLTITAVTQGSNGSVAINPNGTVTYTPAANYHGPDTFTYTINDGQGGTASATVSVTVTPVNDAPVARDDSATTNEDTAVVISVLSNDADLDGDALTAVLVSGPSHGSLVLGANGTFTYTPAANYNGPDSFTYKANDGTADSNIATVAITVAPVNDAPVARDDSASTAEDNALTIGVLSNDSDIDGDSLTPSLVSGPSHGTLTLNPNGSFTYTPAANYHGPDSFTYRANDGTANSNLATVTITVTPVNDLPMARNDSYSTTAGTALNVAAPGVLTNDSDADGDALAAQLVSGPTNGTLALNADGSFTYTPAAGFSGTDSFTYRAGDGSGVSDVATVTLTVNPANQPGATVELDPLAPGGFMLVVRGTSQDDHIDVRRRWFSDQIEVTIRSTGFRFRGTYQLPFTRIVVHGLAGDDHIHVRNSVSVPVWLFGDQGDDHLHGGGGRSLLVGGDGDDHLRAGRGRSVLIGGRGSDLLQTCGSDTILIAGFTNHDANAVALGALLDEWSSALGYSARVANLGQWLSSSTVHDDGSQDHLIGGSDRDWFLASLGGSGRRKDRVSGARHGDIITDTTGW